MVLIMGKLIKQGVALTDIKTLAENLTKFLQGGDVVLLKGDLGAGKTTLVSEITEVYKTDQLATSPTFAIVQEYNLHENINNIEKVIHIDAYRLKHVNELYDLGFETIFSDNALTFIEWGEQIEEYVGDKYFVLNIDEPDDDDLRDYSIELFGSFTENDIEKIVTSMAGFIYE